MDDLKGFKVGDWVYISDICCLGEWPAPISNIAKVYELTNRLIIIKPSGTFSQRGYDHSRCSKFIPTELEKIIYNIND